MNATSSVSSSSDVTYATGLAETAKLKRSLFSIGHSIEKGDLATAGSSLTSLFKAYPQYALPAEQTPDQSDPINVDFKSVSDAVSKSDVEGAKTAWEKVKADLAGAGVKTLSDGNADTAKLLADNKASVNQSILDSIFGKDSTSSNTDTLSILLGPSSGSPDSVSSVLSSWLTYQSKGSASPTIATPAKILNATA